MLVFISDLHLTDGSTCETIGPDAFTVFVEDLQWMVAQACHRLDNDGKQYFEPLERVDLVLLGDIFDVLRSESWQLTDTGEQEDTRPWTPEMAANSHERALAHERLAKLVTSITRKIIGHNFGHIAGEVESNPAKGLEALRKLVQHGIEVSAPDGVEVRGAPSGKIPLKTWYMPGNHDWFYNVGLEAYDPARQLLVDAFALAHAADRPFPHTIDEAPEELRKLFAEHKTYAQHGDLYDGENIQLELDVGNAGPGHGRRAHSSIGDMIVIELLNGLPGEIRKALESIHDPLAHEPSFLSALKELDNVRPMLAVPQWLAGLLRRYESSIPEPSDRAKGTRGQAMSNAIGKRLQRLTSDPFAKRLDKSFQWGMVDTLRTLWKAGVSIEAMSKFSLWREKKSRPETYRNEAMALLISIRKQHIEAPPEIILFGHTHHPEVVPLDVDPTHGWVYINTGTWRRVLERVMAEDNPLGFLSFHVMSFAAVYKGSERNGRPYETWTGTLGLRPKS